MSALFRTTKHEMLLALGAAWLLFAGHSLWGYKASDTATIQLPSGIKILTDAYPRTATVGDPIRVDLDITVPQGYQAEIPKPISQSTDFSIIDFLTGPALPDANKLQESSRPGPQAGAPIHHRARVVIAIYKMGKFTFPSIPVIIKTAEGKDIAASSPPVDIQIQSVLTEKNPALKDLKKQAEIPEPTRWLLWGSLALAAFLLCGIAWYFWRQRRRKSIPLSPAQKQDLLELAEADLRNLLAQGFPEKGNEKQFYVLLSEIAKRILSAGYGIHTAEQTTSEIMEALDRNPVPGPEERKRVESFLLRCDVVKFAKYVPSSDEHAGTTDEALRILAVAKETVGGRQPAVASNDRLPAAG
jgi:hypothetical protein